MPLGHSFGINACDPGGWCHFSFFYPALWWFYEQMGHGASALVSAARIIMTTERPDTWGFFSSVG